MSDHYVYAVDPAGTNMHASRIATNGAIINTWSANYGLTADSLVAGTISPSASYPEGNFVRTQTAEEILDLADANFLFEGTPTPQDIIEFVRELGVKVKD